MFSSVIRSSGRYVRVLSLAAGSVQSQSRFISIGPIISETAHSIAQTQLLSASNSDAAAPPDIILTGRSPSKRPPYSRPLDAAAKLSNAIQALKQPGFQSTNREWLSVIIELSKLKRYGDITSLWKQWMTTLPSGASLAQMSVSEKRMFLPSEAIFLMLLKCPAAVVTGDEAVQYLDTWRMEMTGQLHRMMVVRHVHADELQSAYRWLGDLYKRNLRSSAPTETPLFRQLFANPLFTDKCYELVCQAWDRSSSSALSLDAGWCAAVLQSLVQHNDQIRCLQMAQKLLDGQIGSHSFSTPELYGPLVDVLLKSSSSNVADELTRNWHATVPKMDMTLVASSKQMIRSLLDREEIDECIGYCLSQSTFGHVLRSSFALVLHVLEKKQRLSDMQQVWTSWVSSIPTLDVIRSMTPTERSCLLPLESDLAFILSSDSSLMSPEDALAQLTSLDITPSTIVYNAILSYKVRDDDFEGAMACYQQAIEAGIKPNEQTIAPVVSAVRALMEADSRPTHLHSLIVNAWEHCMSSTAPMTSDWADVFLWSFEHYEDEIRGMQVIECILSPKISDSTPKLVGSFVTRVNVMLLNKGRKPLPHDLTGAPIRRIFHN